VVFASFLREYVKDRLIDQLKERSPQTTAELAKEVKGSWHRVQENLLELCLDGKVRRMIVGGRYLWFYETKKKASKGMSVQAAIVPLVVALLIFSQAVILAQANINATNETPLMDEIRDVPTVVQTNHSNNIIVRDSGNPGILDVVATDLDNTKTIGSPTGSNDQQSYDLDNTLFNDDSTVELEKSEYSNETGNSTNSTEMAKDLPHLVASISNYNVTRGGQIVVYATIKNDGTAIANKIVVAWQLPLGLQLVSQDDSCTSLLPDQDCTASLTLTTPLNSEIGKNHAKIVLNYEYTKK
jgi:hypothetical protein